MASPNFESTVENATQQALEKLDSKLKCSICHDTFKEPKLLPCFHVFCKSPCLEKLVVRDPDKPSTLTCPTCRYLITLPESEVAGLQTDFHIEHLFEIKQSLEIAKKDVQCQNCNESTRAVDYCQHCRSTICEKCANIHAQWSKFRGHKIISLAEVESGKNIPSVKHVATCQKHSKAEAKLFCEECSELVCSDCILRFHRDHTYKMIDEIYPEYKEEIASGLTPLKQQQSIVQRALDVCDAKDQAIKSRKTLLIESYLIPVIDQLKQDLEQRKKTLIETLDSITEEKLKELASFRDHIETIHVRMSRCVEYAEGCLQTGIEGEVVAMKAPLLKQIKKIRTEYDLGSFEPDVEADMELLNTDMECQTFGEIVCDPVCPQKSYASGDGANFAVAEVQTSVQIHLLTKRGQEFKKQIDVKASLIHSKTKTWVNWSQRFKDHSTILLYQPALRGKHSLDIQVNNESIQDSPFVITVAPSLYSLHCPRIVRNFIMPYGTVTNTKNELLVIERHDYSKHCVTILSLSGDKRATIGMKGSKTGNFDFPRSVAVDIDDNIYVADKDNHRIQKFTSEGEFIAAVGSRGNNSLQFAYPNGICFSKVNHYFYICDQQNNRIQVITSDLKFIRSFGTEGEENGQFKLPMFACFNQDNHLYVTDSGNNRVQVFTEDGHFVRSFSEKANGERLQQPFAIAIDTSDIVYVSEWERNNISLFTAEGKYIMSFGSSGNKEGEFDKIRGIHIDQKDTIFVSDHKNNRVQIF